CSELISHPRGEIGRIFAGRCLAQKTPGEKSCIVQSECSVTTGAQIHFDSWLMTDEPRLTKLPCALDVAGNAIDRITCAPSPEEDPVCNERDVFRNVQFQVRVQIKMIKRADWRQLAEVRALWKERVEGFEVSVVGVFVSARDIRFETNTRPQWCLAK